MLGISRILHAVKGYTGPADGLSHPQHEAGVHRAAGMLLPFLYRVRVQGREHLPLDGPQVYAFDHPSYIDPIVTRYVVDRDVRSMAKKELFYGPLGPLVTWGGAFPVDRGAPGPIPVRHAEDVLKHGLGLAMAPSGGCIGDPDQIPPYRKGFANCAIRGGAENVVPMVFHYHPDDHEKRPIEKALTYAAAAAITTGAVAAVVLGGPAVVAAAGVMAATVAGASGVAWASEHLSHTRKSPMQALITLGKKLAGIGVGAVVGGTAAAVALAALPAVAPAIAAGAVVAGSVAAFKLARDWQHRDIADVVVGNPIAVKPYIEKYDEHEAAEALTRDLHTSMGRTKAALTGVPYDESAPKIAQSHAR